MGFSKETIARARGDSLPEIAVLLAFARPRVADLGTAGNAAADPARDPAREATETVPLRPGGRAAEPDRLFEIARLNKMLGWLPLGTSDLPPGCAGLASRLLQVRLRTAGMNRAAMAAGAEVSAALAGAGLAHVVLKGPFQQVAVHGQPFLRPSGDVDLFVAPRARRDAAGVLKELGFDPLEDDRALWWVAFLGEQHFRRERDGMVIDLHHRLQQAGLPGWRGAAGVLERAVVQPSAGVPVPSAADGCLLMAVTIAKALLAREPFGWAAVELAHWLSRLDAVERNELRRIAAASGQARTLALGIALARACCGQPALAAFPEAPPRGLPEDPALLRDLAFQPWQREAEAPRRRRMLRMLSGGRPDILAFEAARAALSVPVRRALERRGGRSEAPTKVE